ncbi:putative endo-beta-1,4-glucanase D [Amylocarpus encephaloides]|uniref:AA9 family lytic polysaccharide monooxygenase n=1 Tax=Amylocarpus encephaloides TaxID=45428 RepID=A0A9P7YLI2_9HELO|nr:putative endo-beta-1,4-glucanase D [Amylocarpus encephaloides]
MKYSGFLASAAVVALANAHTTIYNVWVDDVDQGVGNTAAGYIRSPPNNSPIKDITSTDMTCNVNNVATAKTIDVQAGSKITLEWHHESNSASDDIIDGSHKGPTLAYIAPTSSNGAGDVWVKLAESGYDAATKLWAVDTLRTNKGKTNVIIPTGLTPGEYLLRGEIIALHESDTAFNVNPARGAQLYMECVQLNVLGSGATTLPAGVAIPGAYSYADPGIVFNLYGSFTEYTIPGPAVWDGTTGETAAPATSASIPASSSAAAPVSTSAAAEPTTTATFADSVTLPTTLVQVATSAAPVVTSAAPVVSASKSAKDSCKPKSSKAAAGTSSIPTTLQTITSPAPSGASGAVTLYGQCGGTNYIGSTTCATGTCKVQNPYYSQCVSE